MPDENDVITAAPVDNEPIPGSDEYNQMMADKADATNDPNPAPAGDDQKPAEGDGDDEKLLAGKYKTEEELHKGIINKIKMDNPDLESFYKSLEKGKPGDVKIPEGDQKPPEDDNKDTEGDQTGDDDNSSKAGDDTADTLDFTKYTQEFEQSGELSKDSYDELTKTIPKEIVDGYLEGMKSKVEASTNSVYETVGGPEKYQEMVTWAASNLEKFQIESFNEAITSPSEYVRNLALTDLKTRFESNSSNPPAKKVQGDNTPGTTTGAYGSRAEMMKDMNDPRYQTDPKFRSQVANRLAKSNF